jgi:hypothetical protein
LQFAIDIDIDIDIATRLPGRSLQLGGLPVSRKVRRQGTKKNTIETGLGGGVA